MPQQQSGENAGTLLPNTIDTFNSAYDPNLGPALAAVEQMLGLGQPPSALTNILAQTIPDYLAGDTVTLTAGTVVSCPIWLQAGVKYSKLSVITAATAASTPTNQWAGLATNVTAPVVLAISADGTSTAIAADTVITYTLGTAYTPTTTGYFQFFICVAATTGPTVAALSLGASHGRANVTPYVAGNGGTSKTTPPAVGAALTAVTVGTGVVLAYAT